MFPIAPGEGDRQYVSELRKASTKANEPKALKMLVINEIGGKAEKRTQARYQPWYQSLTAILAPVLQKFVWIASALLRILGCGSRVGRRPSLVPFQLDSPMYYTYVRLGSKDGEENKLERHWEGLPPKPRCLLE